ncbi:MAG: hypothetical protein V1672_04465 [Candidatus Diapherotrites archaeon]
MNQTDKRYLLVLIFGTMLAGLTALISLGFNGKGPLGSALSSYVPPEVTVINYIGLALGAIIVIGGSIFFIKKIMD